MSYHKPRTVAINPENYDDAERLTAALHNVHARSIGRSYPGDLWDQLAPQVRYARVNDMRGALREYANPTPPKPEEPTGLGAVVEDAEGEQWVRSRHEDYQWIPALRGRGLVFCAWDEIDAVKVLSEGVSA